MDRSRFRQLAVVRLDDARALFERQRYAASYYLAGYAVECALKAVICRSTAPEAWPPPPRVVQGFYTHDLSALLRAASLDGVLNGEGEALRNNWALVKDWSEESRYQEPTVAQSSSLLGAIQDPSDGVLAWLQKHW